MPDFFIVVHYKQEKYPNFPDTHYFINGHTKTSFQFEVSDVNKPSLVNSPFSPQNRIMALLTK